MDLTELQWCLLPVWYDRATPEDQAALEANCTAVNSEIGRGERAKRECLVKWILDAPVTAKP